MRYFFQRLIGIILFLLALVYLYKPDYVKKLNMIARQYIFDDTLIRYHRKVGIILVFLSILILFSIYF